MIIVPPGFEAFAVDTEFAGFVLSEQIVSDFVDEGEVLCGNACRLRQRSSPMPTSNTLRSLFSMPQCSRMTEFRCAAPGFMKRM